MGTPRLKFVLETEEKTKKLLVVLKGFSAQHITLVAQGDSSTALKSSPTMRCPFQSPHSLPSPTADTSQLNALQVGSFIQGWNHWGLFF